MSRKKQKILLYFLIIFSVYCAISIGQAWDENFHIIHGKVVLDYLFSLGKVDVNTLYRENYSSIYWSLSYLLTQLLPIKYQIESSHLVNLIFSLSVIFGIGKLGKELFNKKIGKIIFLILFFYPAFFGHMAINSKDTILALSHVWISYLIIRYLKKQDNKKKIYNYIFYVAILVAVSVGIQLVFLGSLAPIILFALMDIYIFKIFTSKNFSKKKLLYDSLKCFIIFYLLLILFWIDVHSNILILPFKILVETFSDNFWTGWPANLINGNYYLSSEVPKSYFLTNLLYKTPEYILVSYLFFIFLIIRSKKFFKQRFKFFYHKIFLIMIILLFPNFILFVMPYPLYDGMRLFIWTLPYLCIVPGITIYYLMENFKYLIPKISSFFLIILTSYFLLIFFSLTPFHYTYLNILNGKSVNWYKKFENDYWGSSVKELIKNINLNNNEILTIAGCGVNTDVAKNYLAKRGYIVNFVSPNEANYIIMTNRTVVYKSNNKLLITNCFDKFEGEDLFEVKRNKLLLSTIRKIN